MKDGVKFTIRELKGVYVKHNNKVYEVDFLGEEYYVPGLAESLSKRLWNAINTDEFIQINGYRSKSDIEGRC